MVREMITRRDIDSYKRDVLERCVLVRLDEAASIMAVSTRTVLRRVEEGRITPYNDNPGKQNIRFLASELREYVNSMRMKMQEA